MARIPLNGGAYSARDVIASAQRCVNLYPEINPVTSSPPVQVTHYLTPGLALLVGDGTSLVWRCLYKASNGKLYALIGQDVYSFASNFAPHFIGTISGAFTSPASMQDNGTIVVLVDNSANGYWWDLAGETFHTIADAAFYGSRTVCFLDGFFIFFINNTNQFYLSPYFWNGTDAFDPTYIAAKTGGPDKINGIAVVNGELSLVGAFDTEIWYDAGGQDFPFARQPGVFIQHGMLPGWSLTSADTQTMWLGQDPQGQCIVFKGTGYQAIRVSNSAVELALQSYTTVNDAIGFIYQQDGHSFYFLTFPTADKTWVYDLATDQWHERTWTDPGTGLEHRHRANCFAFAYGKPVVGDWQKNYLYEWSLTTYVDRVDPIVRRRGFPHLLADGQRLSYSSFIADMDTSQAVGNPLVSLRWNDARGAAAGWGTAITLAVTGQGDQSMLFRQLGIGRDRVFELFWSFGYGTALNGAWVETEKAET